MAKKTQIKTQPVPRSKREIWLTRGSIFLFFAFLMGVKSFNRHQPFSLRSALAVNYVRDGAKALEEFMRGTSEERWFPLLVTFFYLLLFFALAVFVERYISGVGPEFRQHAVMSAWLFLMCPATISFIGSSRFLGRADIAVLFFCLVFLLLLRYCGKYENLILFVPALSFLCVFFQTTFVVTYIPLIVIPLLDLASKAKSMKVTSVTAVSFAVMAVTYFSIEKYPKVVQPKNFVLFASMAQGLLIIAPLLALSFSIWYRAIKRSPGSGKFIFALCMIAPLLPIVKCFIFAFNTGRWMSAAVFTQILLVFYFAEKREPAVSGALEDVFRSLWPKRFFLVILLCVYAAFSRTENDFFGDFGINIMKYYPF